jgi:hypothetical protein
MIERIEAARQPALVNSEHFRVANRDRSRVFS